jgi:hypothetical protein
MNPTKRIVLVLGAGASCPYGFPPGSKLIRDVLSLDTARDSVLARGGFASEECQLFKDALRDADISSVDRFLESRAGAGHHDFMKVGKAMMALALSQYESIKLLRPSNDMDNGKGRWYDYLLELLSDQIVPDKLFEECYVSIITFNYDRSLEFWIMRALAARYGWALQKTKVVLRRLRLVHVHGTLGGSPTDSDDYREFEPIQGGGDLDRCIKSIQVVHEVNPNTKAWEDARKLLSEASIVVFLGFGYLRANVERLKLNETCRFRYTRAGDRSQILAQLGIPEMARVHGTCSGFTPSQIGDHVMKVLGMEHKDKADLVDTDVLGWMKSHVALMRPQ